MWLPLLPELEEGRERWYLAIIAAVAALRFINLGFVDMQAWDEAVYALRAAGILQFGGWIDQTAFSVDGLYSSFHPPLHIWLTALVYNLIGVSEFSTRFVSALFGGATLFVIYYLGRRIASAHVGFVAALLFGLTPFVSFYARQGQLDTTMTFFIALAFLFLVRAHASRQTKEIVYAGLAVGGALMSRSFVGAGVFLAYAAWNVWTRDGHSRRRWRSFGLATLMAAAVTLPWYIYMIVVHGDGDPLFFVTAADLYARAVTGFEGNVKPLEIFYFVNQLVVLFPLAVAWFAYGLWRGVKESDSTWMLTTAWFLAFFLVFSAIRSKLAVYILPALPAMSLLAARELYRAARGEIPTKHWSFLFGGTLVSILWSASQEWRNTVKAFLRELSALSVPASDLWGSIAPFLLLLITAAALTYVLVHSGLVDRFKHLIPAIVLVASFVWTGAHIFYLDTFQHNDGGKELSELVREHGIDHLLVAGFERNPQISYYFGGVDLGWREDMTFRRIVPPQDRRTFASWLLEETMHERGNMLLVLEKDKFIRYEVIDPLAVVPPDYELVFESRRYAAFRRARLAHYAVFQN